MQSRTRGIGGDPSAVVDTRIQASDITYEWKLKVVCSIMTDTTDAEKITVRQVCLSGNLTEPTCTLVARFLGLQYNPTRNAIGGTNVTVPPVLHVVNDVLLALFWHHCACSGLDFPVVIKKSTERSLAAAVYFWSSFLRVPGQSWHFLGNGITIWTAVQKQHMPRI